SAQLATTFVIAIVVGLAPATIDRASAAWQPQAYDRSARHDAEFVRIEVYPARVRQVVARLEPGSIVLADVANVRRVASLAPVYVVGESISRELEDEPVTSPAQARKLLDEPREGTPAPRYLVVDRSDEAWAAFVDAALTCGWIDRSAGGLWILE